MELKDQVAIVTGGGRGIGRGIAVTFARHGAHVALAARTKGQIEQVADEIRALGREALAVPTDMSRMPELKRLVAKTIEQFGQIDLLVNVAGIWTPKPTMEMTEEAWDYLLSVNLKAAFFLSQETAKHMMKRKTGRIISISSVDASFILPDQVHYSVSKAGISHMTRQLAVDLAPLGIRVNAIAPGWVLTDMTREAWETEKNIYLPRLPAGRIALPEDIADVALFLASEQSRYIYGEVISVTGGLTLLL
jgi:3-oxoacyl-[acyl-carrier protein] reductase